MKKLIQANGLSFESAISEENIRKKIEMLGQQITADYKDKKPVFIGVLNGSFIFLADLVRQCNLECEIAFVRLSSYSGTQSTGKIQTVYGLEMDIEDRHLIVVEDIVDTGGTLNYFLSYLHKQHPASVKLAALLLKPDALQFPVEINYLGFEIPDKFVVGYGLDYDGFCRNLSDIYQLSE